MSYIGYEQLVVNKEGKVVVIEFNNPAKKNCVNYAGYAELTRALTEANDDDGVTIVVITGKGEYFTAGNQLSPMNNIDNLEGYLKKTSAIFKNLINTFINCKKVILALVNGPAIGVGATIASLADVAWCAEEAYFYTPFCKLGLAPEACSSVTFPLIMGRSKATEMLVLNEKLSADEAYHYHLVSRIYKLSELDTVVWPKIHEFSELPPNTMKTCKRLIHSPLREKLEKANIEECEAVYNNMFQDEFYQAITNFLTRKSKL
ncbi:hypothetical protein KR093_006239 [Drosophila rubida]|uniref:Enoyl-CoA delta isomerase 2, mitochondrial n=1 Tax=Drosophila rubida TaxID=30044 RepID=A0AAD4PJX5_9MUSC|nr:hypothetical protein KR093_006239 [Drosophila rubida]